MTGHSMTTKNGTYEVVEGLRRCGGAVDLVVAYRKKRRGSTTTYTAFRWEPDGMWKAFNNSWSSVDKALEHLARTDRYALVAADWMKQFLAGALDEYANDPIVGRWTRNDEPDSFRDRADYDDTPTTRESTPDGDQDA